MRSGPIQSIHARISHGAQGAPEVTTRRSDERSAARFTSSGSCQMRCSMVGTTLTHATRCLATRRRNSAGSKRAISTTEAPRSSASRALRKGPVWKSGPGTSTTWPASMP
jgi:hypothetical protein